MSGHTGNGYFNALFAETASPSPSTEKQGKGRNEDLNAKRNTFLLDRYFFYGFYTDKRNAAVLAAIKEEVFLSERRIFDIIGENLTYLQELRKNPPTVRGLSEKYPHINWKL